MDGDTSDRATLIQGLLADLLRVGNLVLPRIGERFTAELGASLVELNLLAELKHAPDARLRMSEISDLLTISTTSVTRIVDALEQRGLAERVLSRGDRRVVHAALTDEGAALLARARPIAGPVLEQYFGHHFAAAEMTGMRVLLGRVLADAGGAPATTRPREEAPAPDPSHP